MASDWALVDARVIRSDDDTFPAGQPTEACATNSRGDRIRVCLELHDPPRPSRIYLHWPGGDQDRFAVMAAHRDAVLFQMMYRIQHPSPNPVPRGFTRPCVMYDYLLYTVGSAEGRPSMHWIPSIDGTLDEVRDMLKTGALRFTNQRVRRVDAMHDIAVLRGDDDFAVAELEIGTKPKEAPGAPRLQVVRPQRPILWDWWGDTAFPIGSRYLCWVDYCVGGMFLCDVLDDDPVLEYLALPAIMPGLDRDTHGRWLPSFYHTMAVDEHRGIVRFAMVIENESEMVHDSFASSVPASFMVKSWALDINALTWSSEEDMVVTSQQLLGPHGFPELPPYGVYHPVVAMDDPRVMCFACLRQKEGEVGTRNCETMLVAIDMLNKVLKASAPYNDPNTVQLTGRKDKGLDDVLLATEIPKYLKKMMAATSTACSIRDEGHRSAHDDDMESDHQPSRKRSHSASEL
ncbi:hypothetical protein ACP4OV_022535 [Aristida adscensionis]